MESLCPSAHPRTIRGHETEAEVSGGTQTTDASNLDQGRCFADLRSSAETSPVIEAKGSLIID